MGEEETLVELGKQVVNHVKIDTVGFGIQNDGDDIALVLAQSQTGGMATFSFAPTTAIEIVKGLTEILKKKEESAQ